MRKLRIGEVKYAAQCHFSSYVLLHTKHPERQWLKTTFYCYHTHFCGLTGPSRVVLTCDCCQIGARDGIIWRYLYSHYLYLTWNALELVRHLSLHVVSPHGYLAPTSMVASA